VSRAAACSSASTSAARRSVLNDQVQRDALGRAVAKTRQLLQRLLQLL
jgi:hypothetical protein